VNGGFCAESEDPEIRVIRVSRSAFTVSVNGFASGNVAAQAATISSGFNGFRASVIIGRMRVSRRDRTELTFLLSALLVAVLLLGFVRLANVVMSGGTHEFDVAVLKALRQADDLSKPIGPAWLPGAAVDLTALGSGWVIGLVVLAVVGFLALQAMWRTATFVFVASVGGWVLNAALKALFQRPRPDVVPHLREVMSLSFPSGHAMTSAAVYLTLGAMLMRISERRATKVYCMVTAMLVTVLVGSTRVYLGVHYPSDVVAGWLIGMSWAVGCWMVERSIERWTGMRREQHDQNRP
jgi:undecaprenyl-diphosphatase